MTTESLQDETFPIHTPVSTTVHIPVSIGELWDKYIILLIKHERIRDREKRILIEYELDQLQPFMDKYTYYAKDPEFIELINVNESLWKIEDSLRVKEAYGRFDQEFIDLAREAYYTKDTRAAIKKRINVKFGSAIHEVKDYIEYA
jgi:hypothetical protein